MIALRIASGAAVLLLAAAVSGCAGGQVKKSFNDRAAEIGAKLAEAERLGARSCSPKDLARARVELARVIHETEEPHYPREWLHRDFDKVELVANGLLETRRQAASLGTRFRCAQRGG